MSHTQPVSRPWSARWLHCRMLRMGIAMVLGVSMLGDAYAWNIHIPPIPNPHWKIPHPIPEHYPPVHPTPEPMHPTSPPPWRRLPDLEPLPGSKKTFPDLGHAAPASKVFENLELLSESARRQDLLEQNERTGGGIHDVMYITLEADPVGNSLYRVEYHGSKPKHINTMQELAAEISRVGKSRPAQSVALIVDGPAGAKGMRALQMSLEQWNLGVQTSIVSAEDLHLLLNMGEPVSLHYLGPTKRIQAADGRTYFQQDMFLRSSFDGPRMSIFAWSQKVLEKFVLILLNIPQELNVMARVQLAKLEAAGALNMSLAQIDKEIRVQFQNSQLAQWHKPELDTHMVMALAGSP